MGVQVDLLTRGKTAHEKEFIDFEFNGRHISEFGLVAVFGGDRHTLNAIPDFEDETSEVEGLGGQYFWGSRYKAKTRAFTLHTDGMTEMQLNDFKAHFQPGRYGKFVEDKMACRYAYARLQQAVTFNVVPFKTTVQLMGRDVEVNEYKGEGTITFVFDEPYSYANEPEGIFSKMTDELTDAERRAVILNNIPTKDWRVENSDVEVGYYNKYLTIQTQPEEVVSAEIGDTITLNVKIKETELVKNYQWQVKRGETADWADASGGKTDTYSFIANETQNGYQYRCKITDINDNAVYSIATIIAVPWYLRIVSKSFGVTVNKGETATFSITVDSVNQIQKYEWYRKTSSNGSWTRVTTHTTSSKTDSYSMTNVSTNQSGYMFKVKVFDTENRTIESSSMYLTVRNTTSSGGVSVASLDEPAMTAATVELETIAEGATKISELPYFNPSTVPTKTKIQLIQEYSIPNPESNPYLTGICDSFNSPSTPYNEIRVQDGDVLLSTFRYTTPNVVNSINKAISIAQNYDNTHAIKIALDIEELMRESIVHPKVLNWAMGVLTILKTINGLYDSSQGCFRGAWLTWFKEYMPYLITPCKRNSTMLADADIVFDLYTWDTTAISTTIIFDGYNSKATVKYTYNTIGVDSIISQVAEEECGEMILSPYLKLEGKDSLILTDLTARNTEHKLVFYSGGNSATIEPGKFILDYKYTYL